MFSSTSLCSEQQLSGILIRELEDEFEPSFEFGLLGLLTEVLASNADGTRGLVGVDFSPRITALGLWRRSSSLLVPGLDLELGQWGRGSVILLFCYMSGFSAPEKTVQIVNGQNQKRPTSWNVEKGLTTIRLIRLKIEIIQLNTAC